jgi:MYXO-CTERM domain-containing protein
MRPLLALPLVLAFASTAHADVPPPPDSPDAHCTLAEQCDKGVLCPYAFHPGKPPAPGEAPVGEACRSAALAQGLERRCRHGGNYGGEELFCPKGATGSWSPPGHASSSRCSVAAEGGGAEGAEWLAAVAGCLALFARRRRIPRCAAARVWARATRRATRARADPRQSR